MWRVILLLVLAVPARAEDHKCVIEKPIVSKPVKRAAPRCNKPATKIADQITEQIVKAYKPQRDGTPEVKFPCDGLGPRIHEITIERGRGHGGTLELWRARRRADGQYDARGILYQGHLRVRQQADAHHKQAAGVVALPELATARAATTAKVREVAPPPKPGDMVGMSGSVSSHDFHIYIRFVDDEGRVVERRFTGYSSSSSQDDYLGLEIAERALQPIWSLVPDPDRAADDDDRSFFAASFNAAVPHFDDSWWVMERYVDLARFLGTPKIIGGLLTRLSTTKLDRSAIDARNGAIDALARITGWDARKTTSSVDAAAEAYLKACR